MLKSREWIICALLAAAGISQAVGTSQAALLDFVRPKRPAETERRGQSPDAARSAAGTRAPIWQPAGSMAVQQATYSESSCPSGWGYDSSPCSDSCSKGTLRCFLCGDCGSTGCFNCGEFDHCQTFTRFHRKKCHQTWYPRLAPYCQTGWGFTQPCWRRMEDNYNCPRPQQTSSPRPQPTLPAPPPAVVEPQIPEPPSVPTTSAAPAPRANVVKRAADVRQNVRPVAERQAPQIEPETNRFTSYADTLEAEQEGDDGDEVEGTLESQMEGADAETDVEGDELEDSDPPAIEE